MSPSRAEELLGRAAVLLSRTADRGAVDFLKSVEYAELWNIHTTGDFGDHIPGTQGVALFVQPERLDAWWTVSSAISQAMLQVSQQIPGKLVTEVNALPLVEDYDPNWRGRI
jgi:hypothetical protein